MKSHMQPTDITREHLNSVCRSGSAPCEKLGFRTNEGGTRIITCARDKAEFESPSEINTGKQHVTCTYNKRSAPASINVADLSTITGVLGV